MAQVIEAAGPAGGAAAPAADAQQRTTLMGTLTSAVRMVVIYSLISYFSRSMFGGGNVSRSPDGTVRPAHNNLWPAETPFRLTVHISERDHGPLSPDDILDTWRVPHALTYDWATDKVLSRHINLTLSEAVQHNASVYAHIQFQPETGAPAFTLTHRINVYRPRPKLNTKMNLVSGVFSDPGLDEARKSGIESVSTYKTLRDQDTSWQSVWRPLLHIRIVTDQTVFPNNAIPQQVRAAYTIDPKTNGYLPPVYLDYFWLLSDQCTVINDTVKEVPLEMQFSPISLLRWQLQSQMDASFKQQESFGSSAEEVEGVRRMLMETNPVLLVVTFLVSMLHMVFDVLAFKNDIQFWQQDNKSLEGLSIRTILINSFCQLIIFLYLLDNETSWMVLGSAGVGVLIEFWKVTKTLDIKVEKVEGRMFPHVTFNDKASYTETATAEHERVAIKYLSWVLYPLAVGYALYSLVYNEHKSTYSWILGSATSFVYMFGFILMCPQLYLNYKLKSVAHLPWRMLTYKALNTFIDDLFAFIIKMPMMHRLSCLRDDIVFFIYLYQRWIYRVDYTRTNEYGLKPSDSDDHKKTDGDKAEPAPAEPPKQKEVLHEGLTRRSKK
ncbi:unnamed protein product (mitochondrion) [Plasmodiophora brassicae]|uniref:Uncharacterized protein n=1 Tax=Plasmodiophora brassicae TaxID=37360 RepID=A0A0G4IIW7_PLABS|nr:hypothetical protein PBRA_003870 [Plasmodiophora brassicae]SPQ96444.1 unnamed protein product [Plasmodiophora brassicae]